VKVLIKNDVIVPITGCNGIAWAMEGVLTPESAAVHCGPGLADVCETVGCPPVLHQSSCVGKSSFAAGRRFRVPLRFSAIYCRRCHSVAGL
jgi:hydroxylamine reductase (hybrid-cluster protein)